MCAGAVQMSVLLIYIHFRLGSLWRHPKHLLDWEIFGKQMSNSLPYAGGGFAANIQTDLHNYIVSYYYSPAMFAVYANGCFQIPLLTLLQSAFREAITPDVARLSASGDYSEMRRAWLVAMRKLSFFIFPAFAIMFILRTELITTLFTKAYAESIPIFTVYLLNILFLMLIISPYVRMFPEFKTFFLSFQIVLVPITGLILYLMIHRGGLVGVVAAMVAIQTFSYIVYLHKISRRIGVTREDLSLLTPVGSIILATLVAGLASLMAKGFFFCSTFPTIILMGLCGIIFGVIYLAVAFISGAISPEEKAEIYSKLRSIQYKFRPSETKLSARLDP
jgi:O-antigen/teichoic acid export membrane protein